MPKRLILATLLAVGCIVQHSAAAEQNVVVVLDDSGSMEDNMWTNNGRMQRIAVAKEALIAVLSKLPSETNVGVLALNTKVDGSNWIFPFGPADARTLENNIRKIRARGGTPLGEFLKLGADQLLEARKQQVYGTYRLLVVTDGEANDPNLVDAYLPDIQSRGLITDVIGVDMESDHSLATRVSNYRRADDDSALQQAISEVFAETSTDDQDSEADFEMLAALPDEFATGALKALAASGNEPIRAGSSEGGMFYNPGSAGRGGSSSTAGAAIGGVMCCLGGGFVSVLVVASILLRSSKTRRR